MLGDLLPAEPEKKGQKKGKAEGAIDIDIALLFNHFL
tara:strand:- start:736 stop:846 length:111 start_codon:yes stop_codon:yes gene_type:complete